LAPRSPGGALEIQILDQSFALFDIELRQGLIGAPPFHWLARLATNVARTLRQASMCFAAARRSLGRPRVEIADNKPRPAGPFGLFAAEPSRSEVAAAAALTTA
jgi:hypothetical protein